MTDFIADLEAEKKKINTKEQIKIDAAQTQINTLSKAIITG